MSQDSHQKLSEQLRMELHEMFGAYAQLEKEMLGLRSRIGEKLNEVSSDRLYFLCDCESFKEFFNSLNPPFSFSTAKDWKSKARRRLNANK